jgi:hypothetical protein
LHPQVPLAQVWLQHSPARTQGSSLGRQQPWTGSQSALASQHSSRAVQGWLMGLHIWHSHVSGSRGTPGGQAVWQLPPQNCSNGQQTPKIHWVSFAHVQHSQVWSQAASSGLHSQQSPLQHAFVGAVQMCPQPPQFSASRNVTRHIPSQQVTPSPQSVSTSQQNAETHSQVPVVAQ